jgi:ATP-binding cassette subfamily B (MDR/TAP) protein 1
MQVLDTFYLADNPDKITRDIRTLTFWFVGLGIVTLIASFLEVGMFMWSGARQVSGLRERYLQACLNQEQAYYDTEATSGNVLSGLNEDCQAVQNAIGEKVGNAIHHVGCFLVSIAISLWRGWKLALLMLALTPLIGMAGAILAKIMTMGEAKMAEGYAKANVQSSQAISNMRTVASFRAEPSIFEKYTQLLQTPTKVQTRISTMGGLAGGFVNCVVFLTCVAASTV